MGVRSIRRIEFGSQDRISAGRGCFEPVLRENENLWETSALLEFRLLILFAIFSCTPPLFDVISPAFSSDPRNCRRMPHRLCDAAGCVESGSGARKQSGRSLGKNG